MRKEHVVSIIGSLVILALSVGVTVLLIAMRQAPAEATLPQSEPTIRVEVATVEAADVPIRLVGHGTVKNRQQVAIAPEISGVVTHTHEHLYEGGAVDAGVTLFALDKRSWEINVTEAQARVSRWDATIDRLETERQNDKSRAVTLRRSAELAKKALVRSQDLLRQSIGSEDDVEAAERAYNAAEDQLAQLESRLATYSSQIEEARRNMAVEEAALESARLDLARTQVAAPFKGRIVAYDVEPGQYVRAGEPVVTMVDDSILEIPVKLGAQDARKWLRFEKHSSKAETAWFNRVEPVTCTIRWVEDSAGTTWRGTLHRIASFDPASRTITAVVRVPSHNAIGKNGVQPLVAGMFCEVTLPGRTLEQAFTVPQWAVSVDETVFVSENGRLKTTPVTVARMEGDQAYIIDGLKTGDKVVVTRLINPLENSLLEIADTETP